MSVFVGTVLIGLAATCVERAQRIDELFASWAEAQRSVKSLVIQFTLEKKDPVFRERAKANGSFRLIRTSKGEVFASYEVSPFKTKTEDQERCSGLLNNGAVYLLYHNTKNAIRFDPPPGELQRFLAKYFNPFVRLLDRKHAEADWCLEVVKQDEWYTYLVVRPKEVKNSGWFFGTMQEGRIVFMKMASPGVPKDMPRLLWWTDGCLEYTFDIVSCKVNGEGAPKREEFVKPEDRPDWQLSVWGSRSKR
jgi:hypothetical protein